MSAMASQITSLTFVYSGVDQRKHQRSASLVFVRATGEFPARRASNVEFDDVIMKLCSQLHAWWNAISRTSADIVIF